MKFSKEKLVAERKIKRLKWEATAMDSILKAGGDPEVIISMIPDDVIHVLANNNLHLIYKDVD